MNMFEKYSLKRHDYGSIELSISSTSNSNSTAILSEFLCMYQSPEDIREDILPDIEEILNGGYNEGFDADVVGYAIIEKDKTYLGNSDVGYEDMTLPTEDFKQLWLEWIELLEEFYESDEYKKNLKEYEDEIDRCSKAKRSKSFWDFFKN